MSGRQNRRPKYLRDYEASGRGPSDDEEFDDEEESSDHSGEDYVGRNRKSRSGRVGTDKGPEQGGNRKRQRLSNMQDGFQRQRMEQLNQFGGAQGNQANSTAGIELQGNLLLVYKRNFQNRVQIDNLNIVLKGLWRLCDSKDEAQDFIYKKTW